MNSIPSLEVWGITCFFLLLFLLFWFKTQYDIKKITLQVDRLKPLSNKEDAIRYINSKLSTWAFTLKDDRGTFTAYKAATKTNSLGICYLGHWVNLHEKSKEQWDVVIEENMQRYYSSDPI